MSDDNEEFLTTLAKAELETLMANGEVACLNCIAPESAKEDIKRILDNFNAIEAQLRHIHTKIKAHKNKEAGNIDNFLIAHVEATIDTDMKSNSAGLIEV